CPKSSRRNVGTTLYPAKYASSKSMPFSGRTLCISHLRTDQRGNRLSDYNSRTASFHLDDLEESFNRVRIRAKKAFACCGFISVSRIGESQGRASHDHD